MTTMPDFKKWAINVAGVHCVYRLVGIEEALKQAFDQGRALGHREGQKQILDLHYTQSQAFVGEGNE